ncbi:hypothetical protein ACFE04_024891 [Oxalis oulophora]
MRSITINLCSFALPPSNTSHVITSNDTPPKLPPLTKSANFAQIPSWVSLNNNNNNTVSIKQSTNRNQVENVHLISLSKQGKLKEAHDFITQLEETGVSVSSQAFQYLFETCSNSNSLYYGRLFYDKMKRNLKNPTGFLQNCVIQMFCDCGSLVDAQIMFDEMLDRKLSSWVIIISAYVNEGFLYKGFRLFSRMIKLGIKPNSSVYASLLKSLMGTSQFLVGKQMHAHVIKSGLAANISIATSIANMYVKCGWLEGAEQIFERMVEKKAVGLTGLMVGYTRADKLDDALKVFVNMVEDGVELDEFVFSSILKVCSRLEDVHLGRQIHSQIVKRGLESKVSVGTPLVDFYVKCSSFEHACKAFDTIHEPNDVSWSALICGYCQSGNFEEAFNVFKSLRSTTSFLLNSFFYTNIFQACSLLSDFNSGSQVHADAIKRGQIASLHGESMIITMYSKSGRLDYANRAFESLTQPDTVAWTAIISGHSYHGNASEALRLFEKMLKNGVRPNEVTFIAVLSACSHCGLIAEAKQYLESMSGEYGVNPTIDHYNCMVDVYSRGGLLNEAHDLICNMPFQPDAMSWKCLLSGCWTHRNVELGKVAAEKVRHLDPDDTSGYVLLFNLYASVGKWEEAARFRKMMAERNLRKELGCSWITVKDKVHRFIVGDKRHSETKLIYSKLEEFDIADEKGLLAEDDISFLARKKQLLVHSEKLAIMFGLISTPSNTPIVVFKNLRACKNCHEFAKRVSKDTDREIIVRDSCRFHHFRSGNCSCGDYW